MPDLTPVFLFYLLLSFGKHSKIKMLVPFFILLFNIYSLKYHILFKKNRFLAYGGLSMPN